MGKKNGFLLRLDEEILKDIRKIADEMGESMSSVIRYAIKNYLYEFWLKSSYQDWAVSNRELAESALRASKEGLEKYLKGLEGEEDDYASW